MTIRKSRGKWQFGYKDTYSLDESLKPIICAGLTKFLDVLESRKATGKTYGIPPEYVKDDEDESFVEGEEQWFNDLRKMIYAFSDNPVKMEDYDFDFDIEEKEITNVGRRVEFTCTNEEEYSRYKKDEEEHYKKVDEGVKLFAEKFRNLWW